MFEKYNEKARRALFFARYEASKLGSRVIESEHVLLGVLREGEETVAELLRRFRLKPDELSEMMGLTRRLEAVLAEVYRPDGLNVGMNLGRAAGAGVPDHIHLHVVPRWNGDTNYMTVAGQTRVIPEDPVEAAARLRAHFDR